MKSCIRFTLFFLLGTILATATPWAQEEMEFVDNLVFDNPQRTPSVFIHDEHNENAVIDDCAQCHHIYEDGVQLEDESSEDQSCSECHSLEGGDGQPSLIKAFHGNCKGCHEKEEKGPRLCGECHIK